MKRGRSLEKIEADSRSCTIKRRSSSCPWAVSTFRVTRSPFSFA